MDRISKSLSKIIRILIQISFLFAEPIPLAFAETASFKLYMADTGLLCAGYGIFPEVFQSESPAWQGIKGALTEKYVASALVSN